MKRLSCIFTVLFATLFTVGFAMHAVAQNAKPIPTETTQESVRRSMRDKSKQAQSILPALVMGDFVSIKETATKLKAISLHAPDGIEGDETENDLYKHFRLEFLRVTSQLEKMAEQENLEGTAYAYEKLTANCLACHGYLTDQSE